MNHTKPVLTLLHGFCENRNIWNSLIKQIDFDGRVVSLDLPGFGLNVKSVATIDEMADDVSDQMNDMGIDNSTFIGHSMGGYVVAALAQKRPNLVHACGFFHSHVLNDDDAKKEARNKAIKHLKDYGSDEYLRNMALSLLSEANRSNEHLLNSVHNQIKDASVPGLTSALAAMRDRSERLDFIEKTTIPILWIAGKEDGFMSEQLLLSQALRCKRAMFHTLESSGHLGMMEEEKKSAEIISEFMRWAYS